MPITIKNTAGGGVTLDSTTSANETVNLPTGGGNLITTTGATFTGNVLHGDNVKSTFGTGNDLEIFHDGSHSRIKDVGTGHLVLSGGEVHFNDSSNTSNHLAINAAGIVTKPLQPAFQVHPASTQSNISVGGNNTVALGNEMFDIGSNFASNTFTAPVTGKYQLNFTLRLDNIDTAANYYQHAIITSNRQYYLTQALNRFSADVQYWNMATNTVLADMDAGDTAYIRVVQSNGTAQTDVATESTVFSGYLVA